MKPKAHRLCVALVLLIAAAATAATDACDNPCEQDVLPGIVQKIGMGFNILQAIELQPVIEYCCSEGKTIIFNNKDKYAVPDGITVTKSEPKIECQTVQRYATTMYEYVKAIAYKYQTDPPSWGAFVGIETDWYQQAQDKLSSNDNWLSQTQCEIVVYNAHVQTTKTPQITSEMLSLMKDLPTQYDANAYLAFLNAVGTHYLHGIDNGGSISQETYTALDYVEANGDNNALYNAKGEYYITANENVYSSQYTVQAAYEAVSVPSTLTTIGGDPMPQGYVNFTEWSASVPGNPAPINFILLPVSDLFKPQWGKNGQQVVPDADVKRQNVLRALREKLAPEGYCGDPVAINYNATMCADKMSEYAVCSDQLCSYINLITIDGQRVSGTPPADVRLKDYTFVQGDAGNITFKAIYSLDSRALNVFGGFYVAQLQQATGGGGGGGGDNDNSGSSSQSSVGASTCIGGNPMLSTKDQPVICDCPEYAMNPVSINVYAPKTTASTSTSKENGFQNVLFICQNPDNEVIYGGYTKKRKSAGTDSDSGAYNSSDCLHANFFTGLCQCPKGYVEYLVLNSDLGFLEYICISTLAITNQGQQQQQQQEWEIQVLDS